MFYLLAILFAITPTYIIRFAFGSVRTNFLEIAVLTFWIIFAFWLIKTRQIQRFWLFLKEQPKSLIIATILFLIAAAISTIISPNKSRAAGIFIAFFFEPALTYFPAKYLLTEDKNKKFLIKLIFILIAIFSLYAIIQYFTLLGLPKEWWGNANEPKRALSIFEYPNAFALYLAPLLAFCLPFIFENNELSPQIWTKITYALGVIGLILSMSRGGWLGLFAAALIFILYKNNKKISKSIFGIIIILALAILAIPNLRYRAALPFMGEKSTVSRFSLWYTADKMIKSSPILGKGLYGFKSDFDKYNTDPNLTSLDYPHNIFLNFWVETGILGLLSFLYISGYFFIKSNKKSPYGLGIALFLVAIYVHGLADAPYFKNDLALVFWMVLAYVN